MRLHRQDETTALSALLDDLEAVDVDHEQLAEHVAGKDVLLFSIDRERFDVASVIGLQLGGRVRHGDTLLFEGSQNYGRRSTNPRRPKPLEPGPIHGTATSSFADAAA